MKRIEFILAASALVLASAMGAAAQSDSLGDYARAARKEKRPAAKKIYTNDNLPTSTTISVVGPSVAAVAPEDKEESKDLEKDNQANEKKDGKPTEKKAPEDAQAWREKIDQQNKKISNLEHELDLLQRADEGMQLRDPQRWAEEDPKYRTDIAEKQKQIEEAKAQLQDMQEQARKAGLPSSVSESE